jgi:hypothetical protein
MLLSIRFLIYGFDCVLEIDMNNFIWCTYR